MPPSSLQRGGIRWAHCSNGARLGARLTGVHVGMATPNQERLDDLQKKIDGARDEARSHGELPDPLRDEQNEVHPDLQVPDEPVADDQAEEQD